MRQILVGKLLETIKVRRSSSWTKTKIGKKKYLREGRNQVL